MGRTGCEMSEPSCARAGHEVWTAGRVKGWTLAVLG